MSKVIEPLHCLLPSVFCLSAQTKNLAKLSAPKEALKAYNINHLSFGRDYIIPKPFDHRLIDMVPKAAHAATLSSEA